MKLPRGFPVDVPLVLRMYALVELVPAEFSEDLVHDGRHAVLLEYQRHFSLKLNLKVSGFLPGIVHFKFKLTGFEQAKD